MNCREDELRRRTKQYWEMTRSKPASDYLYWYVKNLLQNELDCTAQFGGKLPQRSCTTLALLVGESPEPLLQAICAYKPTRVVLILNEQYISLDKNDTGQHVPESAKQFSRHLIDRKDQLETLVQHPIEFLCPKGVKPTPVLVFRALREHLRSEIDVVVDITGAKKSMVAGAFLYAAYANVPVSYVDFPEKMYDLEYKRPYGYACRIEFLENPYEKFTLRDWERVRALYARYNFRSAYELLTRDILSAMRAQDEDGELYFEDRQVNDAGRLVDVLACYEQWDNGNFHTAKERADGLRDWPQPKALEVLGDIWPHQGRMGDADTVAQHLMTELDQKLDRLQGGRSFFLDPSRFCIYAIDEVAKIRRLIRHNEDYRSAMIRAVGLYELLQQARILALWNTSGRLEFSEDGCTTWRPFTDADPPSPWREKLYEWLRDETESRLEEALRKKAVLKRKWREGADERDFRIRRACVDPRLNDDIRLPAHMKKVRDKTTHRYLFVPKVLAQGALEIAQQNLIDYAERWAVLLDRKFRLPDLDGPEFQALPWSELCRLCKLDEFLPPNLCEDLKEAD